MTLTPVFLNYLLYALIASAVIYSSGHIIRSFRIPADPVDPYRDFFIKMTIGLIALVVVYACFKANFRTIMAGTLAVTVLYLYWNRQKIIFPTVSNLKKTEWKPMLFYISGVLFLFSYFYFRAVSGNGITREAFIDYPFYAAIGDFLNHHGLETTNFNHINTEGLTPTFYHYFNEWFMALLAFTFNITSLSAYTFIALPVIWAIAFAGAVWITFRFFCKHPVLHWLIAMSLFFILGLGEYLQHIFFIDKGITFWDLNLLDYGISKMGIAISLILASTSGILHNRLSIHFFYPLAILSILYSTFLPVISLTTVLYYIYYAFKKKTFYTKELILSIVPLIYIIPLYYFSSNHNTTPLPKYGLIEQFFEYLHSDLFSIKAYIITIYAAFFRLFVASLLFIAFFLTNKRRITTAYNFSQPLWFFLLLVLLTGYGSYVILTFAQDGTQFLSNTSHSIFIILIFALLCYVISTIKKLDYVVLALLFAFMVINTAKNYPNGGERWNLKELNKLTLQVLEEEFRNKQFTSAYFLNEDKPHLFNHQLNVPFGNLRYITTSFYPVPMSVFDLPQPTTPANKGVHLRSAAWSEFYKFVKNRNLSHDLDHAKLVFLSHYQIDYLFVQKGNKWFQQNKDNLPVDYMLPNHGEEFQVFKLK